jgi:hypothetical protein
MTTNQISFADLCETAKTLGENSGNAADVQIKFLLKALDGAYHNAIDLTKNKHGTDVDDATKLAEIYFRARTGNVIFDSRAANQQKLASTLRTSIKLGGWTKGGNGEPIATVNHLMSKRQKLKQNPATAKRLDDAANTFLRFARTQLKRDTLMAEDELEELCFKPEAELRTVEQIIESQVKALDKLIDGSAANGTAQCHTQNILDARQKLRDELASIAKEKRTNP